MPGSEGSACKPVQESDDGSMSTAAKRQIIQTLDDLPEESVAAVAELVERLRAKALTAVPVARNVGLGGLWKGHAFSEQAIDEARSDAWSGLGREPF
jgi:hypothetical protein